MEPGCFCVCWNGGDFIWRLLAVVRFSASRVEAHSLQAGTVTEVMRQPTQAQHSPRVLLALVSNLVPPGSPRDP